MSRDNLDVEMTQIPINIPSTGFFSQDRIEHYNNKFNWSSIRLNHSQYFVLVRLNTRNYFCFAFVAFSLPSSSFNLKRSCEHFVMGSTRANWLN